MRRAVGAALLLTFVLCIHSFADREAGIIFSPELSVKAGGIAEISVEIKNNPGLAAWLIELRWDASTFSVEGDVQSGESFVSGSMLSRVDKPGSLSVNWYNVKNVTEDGVLFTVRLRAADGLETGDCEIVLNCSEKNTINLDEELVPVSTEPIRIHIEGPSLSPTTTASPTPIPTEAPTPTPSAPPEKQEPENTDVKPPSRNGDGTESPQKLTPATEKPDPAAKPSPAETASPENGAEKDKASSALPIIASVLAAAAVIIVILRKKRGEK